MAEGQIAKLGVMHRDGNLRAGTVAAYDLNADVARPLAGEGVKVSLGAPGWNEPAEIEPSHLVPHSLMMTLQTITGDHVVMSSAAALRRRVDIA
jgi:hypothetical protein